MGAKEIKRVLVIYKKSAYEIYALDRKGTWLGKHEGLKLSHKKHLASFKSVKNVLTREPIIFRTAYRAAQFNVNSYDLLVSVGGDGTFLETARRSKKQPLLGVNSDPLNSVGIFCGATAKNFKEIFERILAGKEQPKKLHRFEVYRNGLKIGSAVLNDVLLCHENPAMMSRYKITVRGRSEEHKNSGLWISTAAGSTGAVKSAGGKALPLLSPKIQYKPRELYAGRNRRYRLLGGVISRPKDIQVVWLMREGAIYMDGPHLKERLVYGDRIDFKRAPDPLLVYGRC